MYYIIIVIYSMLVSVILFIIKATKLDIMALMYDATQQSIRFDALCEYVESNMGQIMDVLKPLRRSPTI